MKPKIMYRPKDSRNHHRKEIRSMTKAELAVELEYMYSVMDLQFLILLPPRQLRTQRTLFLCELYNFMNNFNKKHHGVNEKI